MAHLNAQLSLFDVKFKGDKFPKSAEDILGKSKNADPYTKDQWMAFLMAAEGMFGDQPKRKRRKKNGRNSR